MLKTDFPQIKNFTRVTNTGVIVKQGDNVFRESVDFIDTAFYNMFDFPVKWGNRQHFSDEDGIVLTNNLSEKLFGNENPVGKNIIMGFNIKGQDRLVNFTVKGVLEEQPVESSWFLSSLIPYNKMASLGLDKPDDWNQSVDITFLEASNETLLTPVLNQSKKYLQLYNAANLDDKIAAFNFQPLNTMNFHAYKVNNRRFTGPHMAGNIMLLIIAIATLLLVYFNYMNIAIASASARLKEIGVRKVMGSSRRQIIVQFISENFVLCTIAVIIGLFLAKYIFLPWFGQLVNMDFGKNLFTNYRTWIALFTLFVISALSGATYPSFYISSFKPVNIINGNKEMGSNNRFRKTLLGFQFFLTFLTISTALAFIQETKHIKARAWGYDPSNNLVVTFNKSASFETFKNELKGSKNVKSVSGSVQPLGNYSKQMVIKIEGKDQTVQGISALPGFATQLGIVITKGRDLNVNIESDKTDAVLVNQAFLEQMHWATGIGKNIEYEHHRYQIVGEVNNFHFENFATPIGPLVVLGCKPEYINFVYVKTKSALLTNVQREVEKIWKKVNADLPFEFYYQDTVFDQYFDAFNRISKIIGAASIIMIIISICGIFGLALLILGKKMKEISVRKVLGAGMGNIIFLISSEFLYAIGFAILVGWPVSWWVTRNFFNQITPESAVSSSPLFLSLISLIIMTVLSVSWHMYKANTSNPTRY
ncbi:MAG TPA: FtsX-like permease family protein, partial [Chitinophagaceae bacterium]